MTAFQDSKLWLVSHVHLAKDALHIYVALIVFFGSMLIWRWRPGQWKPWLLVLAAAFAGEAWDIFDTITYERKVYWAANWKDTGTRCSGPRRSCCWRATRPFSGARPERGRPPKSINTYCLLPFDKAGGTG
jgi:hypothetical protein